MSENTTPSPVEDHDIVERFRVEIIDVQNMIALGQPVADISLELLKYHGIADSRTRDRIIAAAKERMGKA